MNLVRKKTIASFFFLAFWMRTSKCVCLTTYGCSSLVFAWTTIRPIVIFIFAAFRRIIIYSFFFIILVALLYYFAWISTLVERLSRADGFMQRPSGIRFSWLLIRLKWYAAFCFSKCICHIRDHCIRNFGVVNGWNNASDYFFFFLQTDNCNNDVKNQLILPCVFCLFVWFLFYRRYLLPCFPSDSMPPFFSPVHPSL